MVYIESLYTNSGTSTFQPESSSSTLTIESIKKAIDLIKSIPSRPVPAKIISEPLLAKYVPVKRHYKKRWMTTAYHHRIQKKWTNRFGLKEGPAAYQMGDTIIVNPELCTTTNPEPVAQ